MVVQCTAANATYLLWSLEPKIEAGVCKSLHFRRLTVIANANNGTRGHFNDFCKFCQPVETIKWWLVS